MSQRITFTKVPWDYKWPKVNAYTSFTELGDFTVKNEVAEAAFKAGVAEPATEKATRPTKPAKKRVRAKAPNRTATDPSVDAGRLDVGGVLSDGGGEILDALPEAE